ncbi:MAG: nucleoside hydrolase-like domain-containing protein, partial [Spirosomataceae bacterium]
MKKHPLSQRIKQLLLLILLSYSPSVLAQEIKMAVKPRIIITADPELDDNNSLIRMILYSSDLQIEGLIYASS